uniref:DNA-directed DNA polymerase n=1 Tax=Tanacetum cinerariifolium TaxID=118510 RepID=A0A6L2M0S9_TANCI|nr:DNA-directed DNA polymerase [Tanacetum cinerariifolium]
MSTHSNSSHLFSPLRDLESLIQRRNLGEPSSLFDFEEVTNNNHNQEPPPHNDPSPMVRLNGQAPQTMEELCQPSINGRGRPITPIPIQATDFDMKQNGVFDDALHLSLFPYSLTNHAIAWYDRLPRNSIHSFDDMMRKFLSKYYPPSMVTKLRNEITKFEQKPNECYSRHGSVINCQLIGGTFMQKTPEECYELIENMTAHHNHWNTSAIRDETSRNISSTSTTESLETCGGPHSFTECPAIGGYTQETAYATTGNYNSGGSLHSNTVPNPRADFKAITTWSGVTLAGHLVLPPPSKEIPEVTKDTIQPSTKTIQPPVAQTQILIYEPVVAPNPKLTIPYPSRANKQKLCEKDNILALKFLEIFRNLHFELSFADALLHMPKFALMFKSLFNNKEKLFDLAITSINDNCSTVILKKLPKKLGDPGKFLIPCDFPEFDECLALADLDASINLMNLSIWKKLSLPELTSTQMILELADRSTTRPAGIAEDVFVKVGKFHFPINFVVVDYVVGPRVVLILGKPFLRIGRALIDVYGEELTLRVNDEAITFKVGQTSKYSYNDVESINRIDVIDVACEEYVQEIPLGIDDTDLDLEGDIRLLEELLNNDPSLSPLPPKEFNVEEIKTVKYSIDEPPELKLKELPSHLEYAFLEGTDKLPVIISKELKDEEKSTLLKVLKSHKRAIAWKISDSKGIDPRFGTHKILMEDDFKPAGGMTVVENEENELIPTRLVTSWRVCIDYRKLNDATQKDHFPLPFMDQMLERLVRNEFYCFLDGFSAYFQIPIDPQDQEKTTFTCPYGTFAYRCMPFCLCNAPGMFQMCMMAIFHDKIEKTMKKYHFMVKEGIVLGHKIFKSGIEIDRAKVDVIAKLPHPTSVRGVTLKCSVSQADVEDFSRGVVFFVYFGTGIWYVEICLCIVSSSLEHMKLSQDGECCFFLKFVSSGYFRLRSSIFADRSDKEFLFRLIKRDCKEISNIFSQDAKPRLLQWILLLQEFDVIIRDKKGAKNLVADHLSRLENPHQDELEKKEITKTFPLETLGKLKTCWTGSFTVAHVFPYGTIELSQADGPNFKVNGHRLKHYFGRDIPQLLSRISKLPHGPMNLGSSQASDLVNKNSSASIAPDLEASRARGFVHRLLELQIFSIWESDIPDLIDLTFIY